MALHTFVLASNWNNAIIWFYSWSLFIVLFWTGSAYLFFWIIVRHRRQYKILCSVTRGVYLWQYLNLNREFRPQTKHLFKLGSHNHNLFHNHVYCAARRKKGRRHPLRGLDTVQTLYTLVCCTQSNRFVQALPGTFRNPLSSSRDRADKLLGKKSRSFVMPRVKQTKAKIK